MLIDHVLVHSWAFSIPCTYLLSPRYKLGKGQRDMFILNIRYTSPTTSSDALRTYPKLTIVAVYYPGQKEK